MKKIIIALLLLASTVYAQEIQKGGIYVWDDFSGGLVTKISPFRLQKNQSDIAENVRFDSELGAFEKRDIVVTYGTADSANPILGMHRLYLNDGTKTLLVNYSNKIAKGNDSTGAFTNILLLSNGDRKAHWLTWHDTAIGTDGYNQPYKYDGSSDSATYLGSCLATDAGTGSGPNGTYSYKTVCYTASYSVSLGAASNSVTVTDNDINLSMIPICPDTFLGEDVTGRKIYRTETEGSVYKLLSNGTIENNIATTLTDSDADGALGDTLSVTTTATPPKGKLLVLHNNRLWIANNPDNPSRIYYSDDSSHDYFPTINYFDIRKSDGDEITFAMNLLGKLTIGKNNTIQKIYTDGDSPASDWSISDPFSFIGCHAMHSPVNTPLGIIYLGNNGIYIFNGQYSSLISEQVTPEIRDINPSNFPNVWGEYYKNNYYMTYTSNETGSSTNDRVLVYDLLSKSYTIDLLNINIFHVLRSGSDVEALYSGASDSGNVYAHTETVKSIVHKTHADFNGTWDDARYIPTEVGGDSESPVLEIAWQQDSSIDTVGQTIDGMYGIIDRPGLGGYYISPALNLNASNFDKLYWNETIPAAGGDITMSLRSAATAAGLSAVSWSSTVTDPSGSDVSSISANAYVQYFVSMDTTNIAYTPNLYLANNYVIKLTYNTVGTVSETSTPIHVRTGWNDLGVAGYRKTLRKIYVYYESDSAGTLDVMLETLQGDSDTFSIDLQKYPTNYINYFTSGALSGELFRLDIQENSLYSVKIRKIICEFDVEPIY